MLRDQERWMADVLDYFFNVLTHLVHPLIQKINNTSTHHSSLNMKKLITSLLLNIASWGQVRWISDILDYLLCNFHLNPHSSPNFKKLKTPLLLKIALWVKVLWLSDVPDCLICKFYTHLHSYSNFKK